MSYEKRKSTLTRRDVEVGGFCVLLHDSLPAGFIGALDAKGLEELTVSNIRIGARTLIYINCSWVCALLVLYCGALSTASDDHMPLGMKLPGIIGWAVFLVITIGSCSQRSPNNRILFLKVCLPSRNHYLFFTPFKFIHR